MILFQTIKKNLAILRFIACQSDSWRDLVHQHRRSLLQATITLISFFAYLLCVAETVDEFMYSLYMSTATFLVSVTFLDTVLKTSAMFQYFSNIEEVLNKSL